MRNDPADPSKIKVVAFIFGFVFLFVLALSKSGWVDLSIFTGPPTYDSELLSTVSVRGSIKPEDLNLSPKEIKKINFAVMKHSKDFKKVDIQLDRDDPHGPATVDKDTLLNMSVVLEIDKDCEIHSWDSKVPRDNLAPQMINYLEKAADEYLHYRKALDKKRKFKLYL